MGAPGAVPDPPPAPARRLRRPRRPGRARRPSWRPSTPRGSARPRWRPSGATSTTSSTPPTPAACWWPGLAALRSKRVPPPDGLKHTEPAPLRTLTMLLEGKKVLVTGVLHESSIAFSVARLAQEQGAEIVLTVVRPGHEPHQAHRPPAADRARRARARRHRPRPPALPHRRPQPTGGAGSTASSTRSPSPPPTAWAATSCSRSGTTWPPPSTCRPTRSRPWPAPACPLMRAAGGGSIVGLDFDAR